VKGQVNGLEWQGTFKSTSAECVGEIVLPAMVDIERWNRHIWMVSRPKSCGLQRIACINTYFDFCVCYNIDAEVTAIFIK